MQIILWGRDQIEKIFWDWATFIHLQTILLALYYLSAVGSPYGPNQLQNCSHFLFDMKFLIMGWNTFFKKEHLLLYLIHVPFYKLEDPKLKISEGSDQNLSCPDSTLLAVSGQSQDNFKLGPSILKL